MEEFHLNKEGALTNFKKAEDDKILKIVNNNNKNSYRVVQETHLEDDCIINRQIGETMH